MSDERRDLHWFRFSLRTLFVVTTVLCLWIGWNVRQVHHRAAIARLIESRGGTLSENSLTGCPGGKLPVIWKVLGAKRIWSIELPAGKFSAEEVLQIRTAFFEGLTSWPDQPRRLNPVTGREEYVNPEASIPGWRANRS
jgi:hypothetical protein